MDARPGIENLCCLNRECKFSGQPGGGNLRLSKVYGLDRIRYLRCSEYGVEFSERKGTALFNCKISEGQAVSVIDHLDRSCGVVATAELVGVCKDAVSRLLRVSGRASRQLHEGRVWCTAWRRRCFNLTKNGAFASSLLGGIGSCGV